MAVGFFAVVLLLLLIFILQNGTQVSVSYLGAHGHLPLGVALLLAGGLRRAAGRPGRRGADRPACGSTARRHPPGARTPKRAAAAAKEPANP